MPSPLSRRPGRAGHRREHRNRPRHRAEARARRAVRVPRLHCNKACRYAPGAVAKSHEPPLPRALPTLDTSVAIDPSLTFARVRDARPTVASGPHHSGSTGCALTQRKARRGAPRRVRALRGLGVTVRKTIDAIIATRCIESGYTLLQSDRDFDAFEKHLGPLVLAPGK